VDDEASASTEDAVVMVFATYGITLVSAFFAAMEIASKVPTSRFLAEITTQGPLVPELRACDFARRLGQSAVAFTDELVLRDFGNRGHGSDTKSSISRLSNATEIVDFADADYLFCFEDSVA
jgi:hypothetical protein